jgi:hypothetical protein
MASRLTRWQASEAKSFAMPASMSTPLAAVLQARLRARVRRRAASTEVAHVGEPELDGLVLADRLPESGPLLRVRMASSKAACATPTARGGDVDAPNLEAAHDLLEAMALDTADEVARGHPRVLEIHLAGLDAL